MVLVEKSSGAAAAAGAAGDDPMAATVKVPKMAPGGDPLLAKTMPKKPSMKIGDEMLLDGDQSGKAMAQQDVSADPFADGKTTVSSSAVGTAAAGATGASGGTD